MSENKTYRILYNQNDTVDNYLTLNIQQDFDFLEVLSLKITQSEAYKLYTSDYGVIVGRVLANDGFGIPNAKISIFVSKKTNTDYTVIDVLYPYKTTSDKNANGIRYNLLPSKKINKCHQNVGTLPSKRDLLDNNSTIEVFDDYYKYTVTTNESGDYMVFGVPTGNQEIHMDLDLSDIGILSQTPRDMMYKGYGVKQFDSPNKFKKSTNLDSLPQIISQNTNVFVYPFWGDETQNEIAITKKTINVQYKFEPTCVFLGSVFTDSIKNYVGKTCSGTEHLGKMSELATSQGSIEMIRKTLDDKIERFDIDGTRLIDNNGVWCYQIPMNLDYVITDEYGNMIPTDDPTKGIPTRTKVRFRVSIDDTNDTFNQVKSGVYLIPNKPTTTNDEDYSFDENCKDISFVDFMWNKVYSVKNYIPRIQKNNSNAKTRKSTGIKQINYHETNNPMPYNNIFIDINLRFAIMCLLATFVIKIVNIINSYIVNFLDDIGVVRTSWVVLDKSFFGDTCEAFDGYDYVVPVNRFGKQRYMVTELTHLTAVNEYVKKNNLGDGYTYIGFNGDYPPQPAGATRAGYFCDDCGSPWINTTLYLTNDNGSSWGIWDLEVYPNLKVLIGDGEGGTVENLGVDCITTQLALENKVINFEFNNDWVNGTLYAPKFQTKTKLDKKTGKTLSTHCGSWLINPYSTYLVKTCSPTLTNGLSYEYSENTECGEDKGVPFGTCSTKISNRKLGSGIVSNQNPDGVFYYKSTSFKNKDGIGFEYMFPTDIILLGSLNDCDVDGIPKLHQLLPSTTFKIPPILHEDDNWGELTGGTITTDGDYISISGIDWGIGSNNSSIHRKTGLFTNIGCLDSDTMIKTCVNAERLCELGVEFDETTSGNTNIPNTYVDGFISSDSEIGDSDSRAMFATLNYNGLSTYKDAYGLRKYNLTYLFPEGFDGSMNTIIYNTTSENNKDRKSDDYLKFRAGNLTGDRVFYDVTTYGGIPYSSFPRYENSFYFYFGLKPGSTAIDKFNSQYYVPCSEPEEQPFDVNLNIIQNETVCSSSDGKLQVEVKRAVLPYDLYLNDIKVGNQISDEVLLFTGLTSQYYNLKVIDGDNKTILRNIFLPKNEGVKFNYTVSNVTTYGGSDGSITITDIQNGNNPSGSIYYEYLSQNQTRYTGTTHVGQTVTISGLPTTFVEDIWYGFISLTEIGCENNYTSFFVEIHQPMSVTISPTVTPLNRDYVECKIKLNGINNPNSFILKDMTVYGLCWSQTNATPTTNDNLSLSSGYVDGEWLAINQSAIIGSTYYVRAFAVNTLGVYYSDVITVQNTFAVQNLYFDWSYNTPTDYITIYETGSTNTTTNLSVTFVATDLFNEEKTITIPINSGENSGTYYYAGLDTGKPMNITNITPTTSSTQNYNIATHV